MAFGLHKILLFRLVHYGNVNQLYSKETTSDNHLPDTRASNIYVTQVQRARRLLGTNDRPHHRAHQVNH